VKSAGNHFPLQVYAGFRGVVDGGVAGLTRSMPPKFSRSEKSFQEMAL